MKNPMYATSRMFLQLLKRDWIKLVAWVLGMVAFAISGLSKMELLGQDTTQLKAMVSMFQNPAMIALAGPLPPNSSQLSVGAIFGQSMTLLTAVLFAIVSIIYVVNRTRKEEDEGTLELIRSFKVGKLANTTAVMFVLLLVHLLTTFAIAGVLEVQHVPSMHAFSDNLMFAGAVSLQGILWGVIALVFAQINPEAGGAKGFSFALLGLLYVVRIPTDISNLHLSWLNPLSWSYLAFPYVENNILPFVLTIVLIGILLVLAYRLELSRDMGAGYLPEGKGHNHARKSLLSYPGLLLHLEKTTIISWSVGFLLFGAIYGSLFGKMDEFLNSNATVKQIFAIGSAGKYSLQEQFMSTIFVIMAVIVVCFAVVGLNKTISEEKRGRQEQLYATPLTRTKIYWTHALLSIGMGFLGLFVSGIGLYFAQRGSSANTIPLGEVLQSALIGLPGIVFILSILGLLVGFLPRFTSIIWIYIGFVFFDVYVGSLISLPDWVGKLNIFGYLPRLPIDAMNWSNVLIILSISLVLFVGGYVSYLKRDMIQG
jgi:ABC-2 type transport system permease protein